MTNDKNDLQVIFEALSYASRMHRDQRRKDDKDTPYINHPIDVARMLVTVGGIKEAEVIAAALLHDTVEDTEATEEDIDAIFGSEIRKLVLECTDDKSLPKQERKRLQVLNAPHKSTSAKCIKLADKISNVRDIGHSPPAFWSLERIREYLDWSEKVVAGLRGANKELEALYDETLDEARRSVEAKAKAAEAEQ